MRFIYTKGFALFVGCICAIVLLALLQAKGFIDPLRKLAVQAPLPVTRAVESVVLPVKRFFGILFGMRRIASDNVELHARLTELQTQLVEFDQIKRENQVLKNEIGFRDKLPTESVPCTVLAQDPEGITDTLVLSCSKVQGVEEGMGVISGGYLVGKVINVGSFTSTARLLVHDDSSVDARVSGGQTSGVVKGSFSSGLILDMVPQASALKPKDIIVTGGINSRIPKNMLIGEVAEIISGSNDIFQRATISSPVEFHNLDYVFVIK